jgi:hypothetical protein
MSLLWAPCEALVCPGSTIVNGAVGIVNTGIDIVTTIYGDIAGTQAPTDVIPNPPPKCQPTCIAITVSIIVFVVLIALMAIFIKPIMNFVNSYRTSKALNALSRQDKQEKRPLMRRAAAAVTSV